MFKSYDGLELKSSELEGRYLIATRDINIGENLLKCKSYFAVTSETLKKTSCFNCIKQEQPPKQFILKCIECNEVWWCSDKCKFENQSKHLHYECKFYKKLKSPKIISNNGIKVTNLFSGDIETFSEIRMIVGLLSRYYQDKLLNNKYIDQQQVEEKQDDDNDDQLTNSLDDVFDLVENQVTEESNIYAKQRIDEIVDYIENLIKIVLLSPNEQNLIIELNQQIRPLIHKTRCNQFGIWSKNDKCIGVAVSPSSSYFNHSCIPNCTDVRDGSNMTFKSLYPISKGDQLSISYIELDQVSDKRKQELKYGYHFDCNCPRCNNTNNNNTDIMDDRISKFYCRQKKCTGLYYSKDKIDLSNTQQIILLTCSNCNDIYKVDPNFFNK